MARFALHGSTYKEECIDFYVFGWCIWLLGNCWRLQIGNYQRWLKLDWDRRFTKNRFGVHTAESMPRGCVKTNMSFWQTSANFLGRPLRAPILEDVMDRRKTPFVIKYVINQSDWNICWVIVGLRLWEAIYRIENTSLPPTKLSIQHVVDSIFEHLPRPDESEFPSAYDKHGFCAYIRAGILEFLNRYGVHLAEVMPWDWCIDRYIMKGLVGRITEYRANQFQWRGINLKYL